MPEPPLPIRFCPFSMNSRLHSRLFCGMRSERAFRQIEDVLLVSETAIAAQTDDLPTGSRRGTKAEDSIGQGPAGIATTIVNPELRQPQAYFRSCRLRVAVPPKTRTGKPPSTSKRVAWPCRIEPSYWNSRQVGQKLVEFTAYRRESRLRSQTSRLVRPSRPYAVNPEKESG